MKTIELTKGHKALVDNDDYDRINQLNWHVQPKRLTYYAIGHTIVNNKRTTRRMHRMIMNADVNEQVDHINGNGLDNRKSNLRLCDAKDNARNRVKVGNSPYKGVRLMGKKWIARISKNRKVEVIGYFNSAEDAAEAYNQEAKKRFGIFAKLNIITRSKTDEKEKF